MCQPRMTLRRGVCTCGCCGCGCGPGLHQFYSPENERECLESYREQLQRELDGVAQRIEKCECS